jgi:hypothetical protein
VVIRGSRTPLVVLDTSSIEAEFGVKAELEIPTVCADERLHDTARRIRLIELTLMLIRFFPKREDHRQMLFFMSIEGQ